jgi:TPR repeat protein
VEAVRWYRLAAEQEHAVAQTALGIMYDTGEGVPQDDVQAHMWFNLAASRSTGEVREGSVGLRDQIAEDLTPDALNEAQRLAREWDAAHPREP